MLSHFTPTLYYAYNYETRCQIITNTANIHSDKYALEQTDDKQTQRQTDQYTQTERQTDRHHRQEHTDVNKTDSSL